MSLAKTIIALLLFASTASAVTLVADTSDGTMLLATSKYTTKLNMKNNEMVIGNILHIGLYPEVGILGSIIEPIEPTMGGISVGEQVDEFIVNYPTGFAKDVYVSSRTTLREEYIHQEIQIENTQSTEVEVTVKLSHPTNDSYYVYAPFLGNPSANHLWVSPLFNNEKGVGVAIYFDTLLTDYVQPGEILLVEKSSSHFLRWNVDIQPGETKTISMKYLVGYASDSERMGQHAFSPPATKQHLLDTKTDPLFELKNPESLKAWRSEISAGSAVELITKVKDKLDSIPNAPIESTLARTTFDFYELSEKKQLNGLEKALIFREIVREKGIPAGLAIGNKDHNYYAWVYAYPTVEPVLFDPAGNIESYDKVYSEPSPDYCGGHISTCNWAAKIESDVICILNFCASIYFFTALILVVVIGGFLLLQYKADFFYKLADRAKLKKSRTGETVTYEIINKDYIPTNPLEEAIFKELQRRMGIVELIRYEKETGFSKLLIDATLDELENQEVIKKL